MASAWWLAAEAAPFVSRGREVVATWMTVAGVVVLVVLVVVLVVMVKRDQRRLTFAVRLARRGELGVEAPPC